MTIAATTTLAAEFQKPVTQWTCAEFLSVEEQFKPTVVYWAMAYAKRGKLEAAMIGIKGIEKMTPQITGECTKAPHASFWLTLKDEWKKVEAETEDETKRIEKKLFHSWYLAASSGFSSLSRS
jgi:acid stress chaperone HdeA